MSTVKRKFDDYTSEEELQSLKYLELEDEDREYFPLDESKPPHY